MRKSDNHTQPTSDNPLILNLSKAADSAYPELVERPENPLILSLSKGERILGVRISIATPEADLSAAVVPGVSTIFYPKVESPEQVQLADQLIRKLEQIRGVRPGTVDLCPMIETPKGVSSAHGIAWSSSRIRAFGVGPNIHHALEGDALAYARDACELQALAAGLRPLDLRYVPD